MELYPFNLVRYERKGPVEDNSVLADRPFTHIDRSFAADARRFVPGKRFERGHQHRHCREGVNEGV